jgi:hypothetical protein
VKKQTTDFRACPRRQRGLKKRSYGKEAQEQGTLLPVPQEDATA